MTNTTANGKTTDMMTEQVKIFVTSNDVTYTKVQMIQSYGSYYEVNEAVKNIVDKSFHCNDITNVDWQYVEISLDKSRQ